LAGGGSPRREEPDMFSVGDLVVHPMHGAGVIDAIVQEKFGSMVQDYYVFRMPVGGLLLKIPTANTQAVGLRPAVGRQEAEQVIHAIPAMQVEETSNWNRRYRENMLHLKSGNPYEVAMVVKSLMQRENARGLSNGERKMLHSAKQILISEIVLTEHTDYDQVEGRINRAMMSAESGS